MTDIRILDPNVVSPTFGAYQALANFYGFPAKLDIDRYTVDGVTTDYVVGVRELDAANLSGDQTNWINQHTVYTHGYGFVAANADQDVTNTRAFAEGDIPPAGALPLSVPQVYYGELLPDYSIVGAQGDAAGERRPRAEDHVRRHRRSVAVEHLHPAPPSRSSTRRRTSCSTTRSAPRAPGSS